MTQLTSLLIRLSLIEPSQARQALQRQITLGDDLGTALLEEGMIAEDTLAACCAHLCGMQAATRSMMRSLSSRLTRLVPSALACAYETVPLQRDEKTLWMASARILPKEFIQACFYLTGFNVEPIFANRARIHKILSQHYNVPLSVRMQRVVAKLDRGEAGERPDLSAISRSDEGEPPTISLLPDTSWYLPERWIEETQTRLPRHATTLIHLACSVLSHDFEHVVLFRIDSEQKAVAELVYASNQSFAAVEGVDVDLNSQHPFAMAVHARMPRVFDSMESAAMRRVAFALDRQQARSVLVAPLVSDARVSHLVYADRGKKLFRLKELSSVMQFWPWIHRALQHDHQSPLPSTPPIGFVSSLSRGLGSRLDSRPSMPPPSPSLRRVSSVQQSTHASAAPKIPAIPSLRLPKLEGISINLESVEKDENDELDLPISVDAETSNSSVIVDVQHDAMHLVTDLLTCPAHKSSKRIRLLVALGEGALPFVVEAFPGALWQDIDAVTLERYRGRDISPICRALVAFQAQAVPYVKDLLVATDSSKRQCAAYVASDIVHPDLIQPLGDCLCDDDPIVRQLAVLGLRRARIFEAPFEQLINRLRLQMADSQAEVNQRVYSARSLGALHDTAALPLLVDLLRSRTPVVAEAALQGLRDLTFHDYDYDYAAWRQWLKLHHTEHRVHWLIQALTESPETLAEAALKELEQLANQSLRHRLPPSQPERRRLQSYYLGWWHQSTPQAEDEAAIPVSLASGS